MLLFDFYSNIHPRTFKTAQIQLQLFYLLHIFILNK